MNAACTAPPSVHTPESADDRTARHLRSCRRITDLAMALAEAAAIRGLQELATPEPAAQTPPTAHAPDAPEPQPPETAACLLFARLARTALHAIALERRVVAEAEHRHSHRPLWRSPDPRRPALTRALHQAAAFHPQAGTLRREMADQLDAELASDPDATTDILARICNGFGLTLTEAINPSPSLCEAFGLDPPDT